MLPKKILNPIVFGLQEEFVSSQMCPTGCGKDLVDAGDKNPELAVLIPSPYRFLSILHWLSNPGLSTRGMYIFWILRLAFIDI